MRGSVVSEQWRKPPHVLVLGGGFVAHHHVYQPGETIAESVRPDSSCT